MGVACREAIESWLSTREFPARSSGVVLDAAGLSPAVGSGRQVLPAIVSDGAISVGSVDVQRTPRTLLEDDTVALARDLDGEL